MTVRARIVSIGNSQGIRIPKILLEQSGITGEVELEVKQDKIIIQALKPARQEWENAFATMAEAGDDVLLDDAVASSDWDDGEWEW